MTSHTDSQGGAPTRRRRMRAPIVAVVAMFSVLGGVACAPQSPPAGGGGVEIDFGPLTIPLPPIEIRPPATTIPLGLCSAGYQPPGVKIVGATVTIPKVRIDPNKPIITVPNVKVNIPQLRVPVSTVTLSCLGGLVKVTVQPDLIIPSQVLVKAVTLNLTARTITFQDPTFTITGVGLGIASLGDLIIPLPPIVSLPLPSGAISF